MNYNILATGSTGNCIILENEIALDVGVSFKEIKPYYKKLKAVFISHEHSDHFKKSTIKMLAKERPTLLFIVGEFLVKNLVECGVKPKNIIVVETKKYNLINASNYVLEIEAIPLKHDVPNYGFKITYNGKKCFYATDTCDLLGIEVKGYDLYLIEGNYGKEEIKERIKAKLESGDFINENRTIETHQAIEDAEDWLIENMGDSSEYELIHKHVERKNKNV